MMPLFTTGARILFQGDSITDGNRGRTEDPNHVMGHGYAFILAAKYGCQFPERRLTFFNRGVSGNTVAALQARWREDTLALKPELLSVLIGVNDAHGMLHQLPDRVDFSAFDRIYDQLLRETVAALPGVRLVLGEPFILPVGPVGERWAEWQAEVKPRQAMVARLAAQHHAVFVPYQQAFDAACRHAPADYWIWDGVHPTYSGHQVMADAWGAAVAP